MKALVSTVLLWLMLQPAFAQPQESPEEPATEPRPMTWTVDGVQREALVFEPTAGSPEDRHPLILAFHGHGGNMQGFAERANLQAHWPDAIVVYPQGLNTVSGLDPQGRKPGWQRLAGDDGDRDLEFVDAMLATLHHRYRIDDRRIFATGFSNGAFFTFLLWNQHPNVYAGFAIVAGSLAPDEHLPVAKPVLQIAGRKDPKVTPEKVEATLVEERRVDGVANQGQPCGADCTLFQGSGANVKLVWHPGGHVYPPFAAGATIAFFRQLTNPTPGAAPPSTNAPAAPVDPSQGHAIQYESHGLLLTGYVYKPQGKGPFPVYMWNHGSERNPKPGALLARFWVPRGFVLFAPIRSGHGDNPGPWIGDLQRRTMAQQGMDPDAPEPFGQVVALHERANDDVVAAYRWIAQQPWVDARRIVIAGGSYGGIQTLLTAERDAREHLGVKCFVAMSPAAESWGNPNWAGRLTRAVEISHAPIFLMQARNDYNLGPSAVLGPIVDAKGPPSRARIFPDHGDPTDHAQGHGGFFADSSAWGNDVVDYLRGCGETASPALAVESP
jgi:polyhydroxybutyrate depolymerase